MTELVPLLAVVFVTAGLASFIAEQLSLPAEALYIVAGIVLSRFVALPGIEVFAEVGAVFVVFLVAMHLQTDELDAVIMDAFWLSAVQILVIGGGAALVAAWIGVPLIAAVLIGMACGLSSSMLGIDIVTAEVDRRLLHGRMTEAVNFMEDLVAILVVGSLPFWPDPLRTAGSMAGVAALIVVALVIRDRMRSLISYVADESETGMLFALAALWAVVMVTAVFPFNTIVAAVVAGTLLSAHPENMDLLESLEPVKEFFAALFFVVLGMLVAVPDTPSLLIAATLVAVVAFVHPLVSMTVLRLRDVSPHDSFRTAFHLDQMSEIVLLFGLGLHVNGAIGDTVFQAVVLAAATTFVTSSLTTHHVDELYRRLVHPFTASSPQIDRTGHRIIAGFGTAGWIVAAACDNPVIVDNDPLALQQAREEGYETVRGDVRDPATWQRAAIDTAQAAVLTVPNDAAAKLLNTYNVECIALTASAEMAERLAGEAVFASAADDLRRTELIAALADELDAAEE